MRRFFLGPERCIWHRFLATMAFSFGEEDRGWGSGPTPSLKHHHRLALENEAGVGHMSLVSSCDKMGQISTPALPSFREKFCSVGHWVRGLILLRQSWLECDCITNSCTHGVKFLRENCDRLFRTTQVVCGTISRLCATVADELALEIAYSSPSTKTDLLPLSFNDLPDNAETHFRCSAEPSTAVGS